MFNNAHNTDAVRVALSSCLRGQISIELFRVLSMLTRILIGTPVGTRQGNQCSPLSEGAASI